MINDIFLEDCLETMSRMSDNQAKVIITSPPYNMNLRIRNGKYCSRQITKELTTKYKGFTDNMPIEQYYEFHLQRLKEMTRVAELVFYNIQIVTGSKRAFFKMIGELYESLKEIIVWDKINAEPSIAKGVLNRQSELILVFDSENAISRSFKGSNFDRGTLTDVWDIRRGKKLCKDHGAVFPEELVEQIVVNFSNRGDLIYDPFCGTGTTPAVAHRLGRNYLGSEIIPEYVNFTKDRIKC